MSNKPFIIKAFADEERSQLIAEYFSRFAPAQMKHNMALLVAEEHSLGGDVNVNTAVEQVLPESIQFNLMLDGTGVLEEQLNVSDELEKMKQVLYYPIDANEQLRSPFLTMEWGDFIFPCILDSLQLDYQLFKWDGTLLRALASVTLKKKLGSTDRALEQYENKVSNAYPKSYVIKKQDHLVLICQKEYQDPSLYLKLAKANALTRLKPLEVGTTLVLDAPDKLRAL